MLLAAVLFACAPEEPGIGEVGDHDCSPAELVGSCTVWSCWAVEDDRTVAYWYAWGWTDDGWAHTTGSCRKSDCMLDILVTAAAEACGVDLT